MQPDISIIVPVYNSEVYLNRVVDSILNQTLTNLEVILVDDGSNDGSRKILEQYEKKDTRIIVIQQENKGVSMARNAGMAVASGRYIGFVDSDDWIEPDMYETMYNKGVNNDCDVVICDFDNELNHGKSTRKFDKNIKGNVLLERPLIIIEICSELLIEGFFTSSCDKIYKKSMIEKRNINFKKEIKIREDFFFNMNVFNASERVIYIPRILYHYVDNKDSACKKYYKDNFETSVKIFEYKLKYCKLWNIKSEEIKSIMVSDFMLSVRCCINNIFDIRNKDSFFQKFNYVHLMLNNPLVISSYTDYRKLEIKKGKGKFERWVNNRIGYRATLTISLFYHISNRIPIKYKRKLKQVLRL